MNLLHRIISVFLLLVVSVSVMAHDISLTNDPITIYADKVEYIGDSNNKKMIAKGNVVATQDNKKITTDLLTYDLNQDILLGQGQITFLQKEGYVMHANKIILSDRMKFGSIDDFTILMPDKSTLKGKFARKDKEYLNDIEEGYYTSCQICSGKSPIWDIKAKSSTLDEEENKVTYKHAIFSFYGTPVLYTPYLSHYTSKASPRSGLLRPTYGSSSYLGKSIKVPYYFNLAPNYDATLNILQTTKRGTVFEGEYRHLIEQGQINNFASITSADHYEQPSGQAPLAHNARYNITSDADLKLTDDSYAGWHSNFVSDKTYRKDYGYGNEDFLTSRIYNRSYQERGFYEVQALSFQNLRPSSDEASNNMHQTPMVMPLFESKHEVHRFEDDSRLLLESNILSTRRYSGADSNRLSLKTKWQKTILLDTGHNFNLFSSLRGDFYHYQNAPINGQDYTGSVSRQIPEAGVDWSYPLARKFENNNVMISPIVSLVVTPYSRYNKDIYNEDSQSNELNDGNLFAHSKYSGIDYIDNTPRLNYGIKGSSYYKDYLNTNILFGQSYRKRPQNPVTGVAEESYSDYIGRVKLDNQQIMLSYQFTLDKDDYTNKTNMVSALIKYNKAYILTDLIYYRDNQTVDGVKNRREISVETGITDYKGIDLAVYATRNLSSKEDNPSLANSNKFISAGTRFKYNNDCITYTISINKDFTENSEKKKNTTYFFDIKLKNIS